MKSLFCSALMVTSALIGAAAHAEDNPWMVRGRLLGVLPDESADLSVANAAIGGSVDIGDQYVPELDITYFFTKNIAAELILAVTPHDVDATGVTVPGALNNATVDLGDVWLLPPTLTLQYVRMSIQQVWWQRPARQQDYILLSDAFGDCGKLV